MLDDGESSESLGRPFADAPQSWQEIDRGLRSIAKRRGVLDVEEAALLCIANRREIWRSLGKPSLLAYMEDVLGYGPQVARDRVRVALALDEMPVLADALECGEQSYSALRELTRIVTPNTQREWRDAVRGKNLRQIEELVAVHRRGDLPSDPPNPDLAPRVVRFELSPATFALLRQAQQILADEHGRRLDDDELVAILCTSVIEGNRSDPGGEPDGRAKHQILTTICESCNQGWQQGGGVNVPISATDVERAECDAQRIGSDLRAKQDIAPKVRRYVKRRDHGACTVPGCRSARFGEVHHIVAREDGGDHETENLTILCFAHHFALHAGLLEIHGRAPKLTFVEHAPHVGREEVDITSTELAPTINIESAPGTKLDRPTIDAPHVGRELEVRASRVQPPVRIGSKFERVAVVTRAKQELMKRGFARVEASRYVAAALSTTPGVPELEQLLDAALIRARHDD